MRGAEFAELKAFAAVVERASFARAADHLGLSPSALSQTIRQLESRLGVRLLNRTTRSVAPTPAGSRPPQRLAPLFFENGSRISQALAAHRPNPPNPRGQMPCHPPEQIHSPPAGT